MNKQIEQAIEFEKLAFEHIRNIFQDSERESFIGNSRIKVDIVSISENGRLLLFEVKYFTKRDIDRSIYFKLSSLKETADNSLFGELPITVLISNKAPNSDIKKTFHNTKIPIIKLGDSVDETRSNLRKEFKDLSIYVTELDTEITESEMKKGSCFIISPHKRNASDLYGKLSILLSKLGYTTYSAEDIKMGMSITEKIYEMIRESDIVIADLSEVDLTVTYELGYASGLGKMVIPIIEKGASVDFPTDLLNFQYLVFEDTNAGIESLESSITQIISNLG